MSFSEIEERFGAGGERGASNQCVRAAGRAACGHDRGVLEGILTAMRGRFSGRRHDLQPLFDALDPFGKTVEAHVHASHVLMEK